MYGAFTDERKKCINEIAEKLRAKYSAGSGIDFKAMARDLNINFVRTNKTAGEDALRKGNDYYLITAKFLIPSVRDYWTAHGFGHILLGHLTYGTRRATEIEEDEADHFAEKLTGISNWKSTLLSVPESLLSWFRLPFTTLKYALGLENSDLSKIINKLESKQKE